MEVKIETQKSKVTTRVTAKTPGMTTRGKSRIAIRRGTESIRERV